MIHVFMENTITYLFYPYYDTQKPVIVKEIRFSSKCVKWAEGYSKSQKVET